MIERLENFKIFEGRKLNTNQYDVTLFFTVDWMFRVEFWFVTFFTGFRISIFLIVLALFLAFFAKVDLNVKICKKNFNFVQFIIDH